MGEVEDLKDQAKRGGVRLPGRHSMKTGHRAVFTDPTYDMSGLIKPRNVVRIEGERYKTLSCALISTPHAGHVVPE